MLAIAHFAAGVLGALALLIWYPNLVHQYIGNLIKNDLFFVLGSGLFAMIPDISKLIPSLKSFHDSILNNIFWFHGILDKYPDTAQAASVIIASAGILLLVYWGKL